MYRLVTERNCNPAPRIVTGHENNRLHTGVLGSGLVKKRKWFKLSADRSKAPEVPSLRRNINVVGSALSQPPDCRTYSAEVTWSNQQSPASSLFPRFRRCVNRLPHFRRKVKRNSSKFLNIFYGIRCFVMKS